MITEDYVSFGIAKLLKKKGFDEECETWYAEYWSRWGGEPDGDRSHILFQSNKEHIDDEDYEFLCYAPTLQMAMKWLREKHNIHPNIVVEVYGPYALYKIDRIFDGDEEKWVDFKSDDNTSSLYNKPEEACEAAIEYCLENLI